LLFVIVACGLLLLWFVVCSALLLFACVSSLLLCYGLLLFLLLLYGILSHALYFAVLCYRYAMITRLTINGTTHSPAQLNQDLAFFLVSTVGQPFVELELELELDLELDDDWPMGLSKSRLNLAFV
jgi:hypothetical protein